jgi:two-component system phosphate regulon sensor histidine kinase PhoR
LGVALNSMAEKLDSRIREVVRQHNELEAVLESMVEGVIAVGADDRVLSMNRAAGVLLRLDPERAAGRPLREVVRNPELQELAARMLASHGPLEGEVVLYEGSERYLQVHGNSLYDAQHTPIGAVLVLNDTTHVRRLESVRRDFVANVSHEIRTPITSIKGYVETLLDGAMDDKENLQHFLEIIQRQADRLNDIIEDLLTLARIEQDPDQAITLERVRLLPILEAAVLTCKAQAAAREMRIALQCPGNAEARLNSALFEQAVVNLLDNAIKYSDAGDTIEVTAGQHDGETVVSVVDHGCGIARDHLPRLFERFYRVDRARSRKLGGTGLGLAIVKHIMNAHQGRVDVQSGSGKGSRFRLYLPGV